MEGLWARLLAWELEGLGAQGANLASPGFVSHLVTGPRSSARRRGRRKRRDDEESLPQPLPSRAQP